MLQHDDSHKHNVSTAQVREKQADKQYHSGVAKVGWGWGEGWYSRPGIAESKGRQNEYFK